MIDYGKLGGDWQCCQCCQGASEVGNFLKNFAYRVANSREFPCSNSSSVLYYIHSVMLDNL